MPKKSLDAGRSARWLCTCRWIWLEIDIAQRKRYHCVMKLKSQSKPLRATDASTRTIISLPNAQKAWLDAVAKRSGMTMTAVVRDAVAHYQKHLAEPANDFAALGERLQGTWPKGDGLSYQTTLRDEW